MAFISASNQLGAFESGVAASLVGTVPAVVAGGALTILLALSWPACFPALAGIDRLQDLAPGEWDNGDDADGGRPAGDGGAGAGSGSGSGSAIPA